MGYYDDLLTQREDELKHYGILGMKWGVRRFQNKDGTLTAEGKARYDKYTEAKENVKTAKKEAKSARREANLINAYSYDEASLVKANKAEGMYNLRKKQLADTKAKIRMDERADKGKSAGKREQALIEKFKAKGYSQEEAEIAAYRRARTEKILIGVGAVAVTAAAVYGAKKYHDYVSDELIKSGSVTLKRLAVSDSKDLHDTFYAASGKKDPNKYIGLYGGQVQKENNYSIFKPKFYQKSIDVTQDMKISSDKHAKDTLTKVLQKATPQEINEIKNSLKLQRDSFEGKQYNALQKGINDISNGKFNTKAAYDAVNINMSGGNQTKVVSDFKAALKNEGYSGIKDRNDMSYSGYNAKTARIIFDTSKVKVSDVRKIESDEITNKYNKEMAKLYAKAIIPQAAISVAGSKAITSGLNSAQNNAIVNDYRQKHPNSQLTRDQILENYYGGK